MVFFILALANVVVVSIKFPPGLQIQFVDTLVTMVLAAMAWRLRSRTAAILLFIQSSGAVIILSYLWITFTPVDFNPRYGPKLILALILTYAAVRMVQATFLLHGRYANDEEKKIP